MTSSNSELEEISTEMKYLPAPEQEFQDRDKIVALHQELRDRLNHRHTEKSTDSQQEIDQISEKLEQLTAKKAELKNTVDNLDSAEDTKEENVAIGEKTDSRKDVFTDESPKIPASPVVVDVENLTKSPSKTQCPECGQVVTTETISSVSDVTWLMCVSAAVAGCFVGCCLIPFCLQRFKAITHKCPMCRSSIRTI